MSECILYALDAPSVKNANDAAGFIEKWRDNGQAPTARIATFFVRALQTWPEDGSKGQVWHEDFTHNRPQGPLLELCFELSEFDADRLAQLRAIAAHHGVLVFDPEGHVLYLADGSEAGVPAMQPPAAGDATRSSCGLRFDGVYESQNEKNCSYLCFTADGQIFWQSIGRRFPAKAVMKTFVAGDAFVVKGKYKPGTNAFSARLKASFGAFKMDGVLTDAGLQVHSERTNGSYPFDALYTFVPLEDPPAPA